MSLRKIITATLVVLTAANIAAWTITRTLGSTARLSDGFEVRLTPRGLPSGYRADGTSFAAAGARDCALVRYVAAGCRYCVKDKTRWNALAARATQSNCQTAGLVPDAASVMPVSAYGEGAENQLAFINVEWVAEFPPTRTPTTMIFGKGGKVIWQHVGLLTDEDVQSALAALPPIGGNRPN